MTPLTFNVQFELYMHKLRNYTLPQGFSLIELMIVIVIIGVLSLMAISLYSGAQESARDVTRMQDLDQVGKAMEVHIGSNAYRALSDDWFAGGVPIHDPKGNVYCAKGNSIQTPEIWSGSCPTGYKTLTQGEPTDSSDSTAPLTSWVICTVMENPQYVYCKTSGQK